MAEYVAGIDLGGTRMRAGIVAISDMGRVLASASIPTVRDDPEQGIRALARLVRDILRQVAGAEGVASSLRGSLAAAGLGAPGPFDAATHQFTGFANLPAWNRFPIDLRLSEALSGIPVALGNDANIAAFGEHMAGAGKGMKSLIYVTLGTGVGGAVILDGKIHSGHTGIAGEFGHVQVDPDGEMCACGKRGCLETFASGTGVSRMYGAPAREVFRRVARGDAKAIEVLQRAGDAIGRVLPSAAIAVDPEAVIVGGGLSKGAPKAVEVLLHAAQESLWQRIRMPGFAPIPFVKGALGDDAGILGAAELARQLV